jgi:hypothetical protein
MLAFACRLVVACDGGFLTLVDAYKEGGGDVRSSTHKFQVTCRMSCFAFLKSDPFLPCAFAEAALRRLEEDSFVRGRRNTAFDIRPSRNGLREGIFSAKLLRFLC